MKLYKSKAADIADEICREINAECVLCGDPAVCCHHSPKRKKNGGVPEILYLTLFPICHKCHERDPNMRQERILYPLEVHQLYRAREHIRRCEAQNVYAIGI